jgi:hypothetical protein
MRLADALRTVEKPAGEQPAGDPARPPKITR